VEVYNAQKLQAKIDSWMGASVDGANVVGKVYMYPVHNGGSPDKSYWTTQLDTDGNGAYDLFPSETFCIDIGHYLSSGKQVCYAMLSTFLPTASFPAAFTQSGVNTLNWPANGVASIIYPENLGVALNYLGQPQFDIGQNCGVGSIPTTRDGSNPYRITGGDKQRALWGLMSSGIRTPGDASSGISETICVNKLVSTALAFQASNPGWFPPANGNTYVVLAPITCTERKWYPTGQVLVGRVPVRSVGGWDCRELPTPAPTPEPTPAPTPEPTPEPTPFNDETTTQGPGNGATTTSAPSECLCDPDEARTCPANHRLVSSCVNECSFTDPPTTTDPANGATTTTTEAPTPAPTPEPTPEPTPDPDECTTGAISACGSGCACHDVVSPGRGYTCESTDVAWTPIRKTETDMQTCCKTERYFSQRAFERQLAQFTELSVNPTAPDGMTSALVQFTGSNQFKPYWTLKLDNNQDLDYDDVGEIQNMEAYCVDIVNTLPNGVTCNLLSSTMQDSIRPRAGNGDSDNYLNFPENFRALNWLHDTVSLGDNCGLSSPDASHQVNGGDLQRATWMLIANKNLQSAGAYSSYSGSKDTCVRALVDRALAQQAQFDADFTSTGSVWRPSRFSLVLVSPIPCSTTLAVIPNGQVLVGKYPIAPNDDKRICADGAPDPCANARCGRGTCKPAGDVVGVLEQYICTCDAGYSLWGGIECRKD